MTETPNIGLKKYAETDPANLITGYNASMDTIDTVIKQAQDNINAVQDFITHVTHQVIIGEIPAHENAQVSAKYAPPTGYITLAVVITSNWRNECIGEVQYFDNGGNASFDVHNFGASAISNVDIRARWIYIKQ